MFAQVIQGKTSNPEALDAALNRWFQDLAPGATGWLGSTSGVTEDGRAIAVVRFETEEDARRNSNRPEQDQWWSETAKIFDGEATFRDSTDVTVDLQGDPKEPPPELQAQMEEMNKLSVGEPEFFDLKQPVMLAPK
jgi:hypothetical protein